MLPPANDAVRRFRWVIAISWMVKLAALAVLAVVVIEVLR